MLRCQSFLAPTKQNGILGHGVGGRSVASRPHQRSSQNGQQEDAIAPKIRAEILSVSSWNIEFFYVTSIDLINSLVIFDEPKIQSLR